MSLVGDALRKARREAAEREVERRGVLFSAHIADRPARSSLGLGLALGGLIALVATVAGGLTVWWLVGRSDQPVDRSSAATAFATEARPGFTDTGGEPAPIPLTTPAEGKNAAPGTGQPGVADGGRLASEPAPATPSPESESRTAAASAAEPAGQRSNGFAGRENGEDVYIMEAEVAGVRLSLDYIVFRADDPFVEVNGIELHVGGVVAGFRVKTIESDRVRLTDGRRTIVLRTP